MKLYLIGSLRNPQVPIIAKTLRSTFSDEHEIFDDWYAAGPEADDKWMEYEKARGHDLNESLAGYAAEHVFDYDKYHLDTCDGALLILPAGKSGHLELGYVCGQKKPVWILLDKEPERYDVMYRFARMVSSNLNHIIGGIREELGD